ncbi:flagellar hook-associated protein 1 FlgK [Roseovarius azorensis]|uniref:Flagellar hook-associated protein 1 n=1 Tax=Roseovarius azorensis TaxID=1287727 RepID=A0A1H7R4B8_9RHOB|nr:flagellar hook-associated protein FlgK [Roseovarius azorensis]SEL55136.1 flagellar hook-associated protein 1 FlgK [Roseovarius azorensis]
MTISGALSNALSGLTAASRMADVVSGNLANVLTGGYVPRDLTLIARRDGGGVSVQGITRQVDAGLLADRRLAESGLAAAESRAGFAVALERAVGTPDIAGSLAARLASFEAGLVTATTRPEEANRLQAVVQAASGLAAGLNAASAQIATLRGQADGDIARAVDSINRGLENVSTLNKQITTALINGHATASLEDQRQLVIDGLSQFVPLRQLPRADGAVALVTTGGALLLDGRAIRLEFDASPVIAPHMTADNGLLSTIRLNGQSLDMNNRKGSLAGGLLAALFDIRDVMATGAQTNLDALARDLIERFQQPDLDPSLAAGVPGLFTDAGAFLDPANEIGLAGRITLNAVVDPGQSGALFRLRDGLGATIPGAVGNAAFLMALTGTLSAPDSMASGTLGDAARGFSGHMATFVSIIAQARLAEDQTLGFETSRTNELRSMELARGVDSDAELQRLMVIEQAFGANARMIQTINDMMQNLLRI